MKRIFVLVFISIIGFCGSIYGEETLKDGVYNEYSDDGKLLKTSVYNNGIPIMVLKFDLVEELNSWDDYFKDVTIINVKLTPDNFLTTRGAYTTHHPVRGLQQILKDKKMYFITGEPEYEGKKQYYGYLTLGNRPDYRFGFALDIISEEEPKFIMYFDSNRNGRLDDEIPLKRAQGSDCPIPPTTWGYSAMLNIPWNTLIVDSPYKGDFKIWFFINKIHWEKKQFSHYSRTQLKGRVRIDENDYTINLVDSNYNDANLTNDGYIIEISDGNTQYVTRGGRGKAIKINNKMYDLRFEYARVTSPYYILNRVIDGDTIVVYTPEGNIEIVELIGIDALESRDNDKARRDAERTGQDFEAITKMGKGAFFYTQSLFFLWDGHTSIELEFDVEKRDKYGHLLAYVYFPSGGYMNLTPNAYFVNHPEKEFSERIFVNASIIQQGYATPMTIPPNVKYADLFKELYEEAREKKRGLWKDSEKNALTRVQAREIVTNWLEERGKLVYPRCRIPSNRISGVYITDAPVEEEENKLRVDFSVCGNATSFWINKTTNKVDCYIEYYFF